MPDASLTHRYLQVIMELKKGKDYVNLERGKKKKGEVEQAHTCAYTYTHAGTHRYTCTHTIHAHTVVLLLNFPVAPPCSKLSNSVLLEHCLMQVLRF